MTTALTVAAVWVALAIPAALLAGRALRRANEVPQQPLAQVIPLHRRSA